MPATYSSMLFHLVMATKDRLPLIEAEWRDELWRYLGGVVAALGGVSLGVGGTSDHVHLLVSLRPAMRVSDLVRELKKASQRWALTRRPGTRGTFHWQEGYGVFTVSASQLGTVQTYIARQEEHHRTRTAKEELLALLQASGVEFDLAFFE